MEQSSLVSAPVPTGRSLDDLTMQVAKNNLWTVRASESQAKVMGFLNGKIKHIIYIVKENRTFDQILGDLLAHEGRMFVGVAVPCRRGCWSV